MSDEERRNMIGEMLQSITIILNMVSKTQYQEYRRKIFQDIKRLNSRLSDEEVENMLIHVETIFY